MASEIKVNTISEKTSANGVTIDSVSLKDGKVATANSIDSDAYVDGSIDTAHIADDQITLAKMAGGTDGNIISYDASGDPVAIATGSDGQVLTSTGAGSPPAFETLSAGKIGQVFSLTMTGKHSMSSTTATAITDGTTTFSQAITPVASSSKILLIAHIQGSGDTDSSPSFVFDRGGTDIGVATGGASNRELGTGSLGYQTEVHAEEINTCSMMFLDSPSTTSATTYKVEVWNADADGNNVYINRSRGNAASPSYTDPVSTFTIMEVLA